MYVINGSSLDKLIKGGTIKAIDGSTLDFLNQETLLSSSLSAIAWLKYFDGVSNIQIPIYNPTDVTYSMLRISTPYGIGAFNLVSLNDSLSSAIRVSTSAGTMCIGLTG